MRGHARALLSYPCRLNEEDMRMTIGILSMFILTACKEEVKHPPGGFPYPKQLAGIDTLYYYYPIKDVQPKDIAFGESYQYIFYRRFREPNISLRPLPEEILRLTYRDAFQDQIIIVLRETAITVKRSNSDGLSYVDKSRLTPLENEHEYILNRWYPIDTAGKKEWVKKYLDSMVKKYPELLDENYYHRIYKKKFVSTGKKFYFISYTLPVSAQQYKSIFDQVDSSGFWTMQNFIRCDEAVADGFLFTLEANTRNQYQAVSMLCCPNNKTKFTLACQNLVKLAKMDKVINLVCE